MQLVFDHVFVGQRRKAAEQRKQGEDDANPADDDEAEKKSIRLSMSAPCNVSGISMSLAF